MARQAGPPNIIHVSVWKVVLQNKAIPLTDAQSQQASLYVRIPVLTTNLVDIRFPSSTS